MFDAAKLDTFFNVHNTFFVFNGTFIEEPFSYTCYCTFFFLLCCDNHSNRVFNNLMEEMWLAREVVITPQNGVFNNLNW